ncbi:MAG: LysE family transporter [Candidatus Thorarchaeota archaeon]
MGVVEILAIWFGLSLTGALAPGPLSAAVVMQASRRDRLHGILPMLGHAVVELGILAAIILSVQALTLDPFTVDILIGFGGLVIIGFGFLAVKDYKHITQEEREELSSETSIATLVEATTQGAIVSILSPYFLLWWFGIGLANVTILVAELQVGVGTVFLAGVLLYFTHISTDFLFGAFLTVSSDEASRRATAGDINWVNVGIGIFQIVLGAWFIIQALTPI